MFFEFHTCSSASSDLHWGARGATDPAEAQIPDYQVRFPFRCESSQCYALLRRHKTLAGLQLRAQLLHPDQWNRMIEEVWDGVPREDICKDFVCAVQSLPRFDSDELALTLPFPDVELHQRQVNLGKMDSHMLASGKPQAPLDNIPDRMKATALGTHQVASPPRSSPDTRYSLQCSISR
jgi:hypothetical protein